MATTAFVKFDGHGNDPAGSQDTSHSQNIDMLVEDTDWNTTDAPTFSPPSPTGSMQMRPFSPILRQDFVASLDISFGDDDAMDNLFSDDDPFRFPGAPFGQSLKVSMPILSRSNSSSWPCTMPWTPEPSDGFSFDVPTSFDTLDKGSEFDGFSLDLPFKEEDVIKDVKVEPSSPAVVQPRKRNRTEQNETNGSSPASGSTTKFAIREMPKENRSWDTCLTPEQAAKHQNWAATKRRRVKYGRKYVYTNKVNIAKARKRVDGKFEPGEFGKSTAATKFSKRTRTCR